MSQFRALVCYLILAASLLFLFAGYMSPPRASGREAIACTMYRQLCRDGMVPGEQCRSILSGCRDGA